VGKKKKKNRSAKGFPAWIRARREREKGGAHPGGKSCFQHLLWQVDNPSGWGGKKKLGALMLSENFGAHLGGWGWIENFCGKITFDEKALGHLSGGTPEE